MDFWRTVSVLFRRWYVVLPALMLSVGGAAIVYASIPPYYESSSVLVLTSPLEGGSVPPDGIQQSGPINPLLNFDYGLSTSAALLIQALSTTEVAAELGVLPSGDTKYQVGNGTSNPEVLTSGPFVFILGESRTAEGARDIVAQVGARARIELSARQDALDAPASTHIVINDVVPPTTPDEKRGSAARAAAAALGLGVLACLSSAYAVENLAERRRLRKALQGLPDEPLPERTTVRV